MAEVKIEEIREMFRKIREGANRALCFGDMTRELKREEEVKRVALVVKRKKEDAENERRAYHDAMLNAASARNAQWQNGGYLQHSGQCHPFFGW